MAHKARRGSGALEHDVLAALAASEEPMTVNDVLGELGGDLAYTTVMTVLVRLQDKGVLVRTPSGRAYAYQLATSPDGVDAAITAHRMRRLLESGDDRAKALTHFVRELDPADEALLASLLAAAQHNEGDAATGEAP